MISFDFPKLSFKFLNGESLTISPTNYLAFYAFVRVFFSFLKLNNLLSDFVILK